MQELSTTRLGEVLRAHYSLPARLASRAAAYHDSAPTLHAAEPAPALLTAPAAMDPRGSAQAERDQVGTSGGPSAPPGCGGPGGKGLHGTAGVGSSRGQDARALPRWTASIPTRGEPAGVEAVRCLDCRDHALGRQMAEPGGLGDAPVGAAAAAWPVPAHPKTLANQTEPSGTGVRPAGRARLPLRPLPPGRQLPASALHAAGGRQAGQARNPSLDPEPARRGKRSAAALAEAATTAWRQPAHEPMHSSDAHPNRASTNLARGAAAAQNAEKAVLAAEAVAAGALAGAPGNALGLQVRSAVGAPASDPGGRTRTSAPARPLFAHCSLDELCGAKPGTDRNPDAGEGRIGAAASGQRHAKKQGCGDPVARELPLVCPVLSPLSRRLSARSPPGGGQQALGPRAHSARRAAGLGSLGYLGRGSELQSLTELAAAPLEALLRL